MELFEQRISYDFNFYFYVQFFRHFLILHSCRNNPYYFQGKGYKIPVDVYNYRC